MKFTWKISTSKILYLAFILMLILTCLPVSMVLPSIIRKAMQGFSLLLFLCGMAMQKQKILFIEYIFCSMFFFTYVYNVWGFTQGLFTCLYNILAGFSFLFYSLYLLYNKEDSKNIKYIQKALKAILTVFIFTAITTIVGVQKYPLAVRELGRSGSGYSSSGEAFLALKTTYRMMNIASWSMLFGMVLLCPTLLRLYQKTKQNRYILFLIICEVCILSSQITIGLILSLLGIILAFYRPSKKAKDILIILFTIALTFVFIFMIDGMLDIAIQITNNLELTTIRNKLEDVALLLSGSVAENASARFNRYSKSLEIFAQYPLLGISIHGVPNDGVFGNHSDIFDLMGYYGISGIIIMILLSVRYFRHVVKTANINIWIFVSQYIIFITLATLNPVWYSPQVFIGAMLMPTLIESFQQMHISECINIHKHKSRNFYIKM